MKCLFFQVQARPQKEVSLLDLDDCEFQLKQELQHPLENSASLIAVVALTRYVFYSPKLGFEILEHLEPEDQLCEILVSSLISGYGCI